MPHLVTLGQLVTRALQRADVAASVLSTAGAGWLTQGEVEGLVLDSATRFYDIALDVLGASTFAKFAVTDFGPLNPSPVFLADDFYRLVAVYTCKERVVTVPSSVAPEANFQEFVPVERIERHDPKFVDALNASPRDDNLVYALGYSRNPASGFMVAFLSVYPPTRTDRFLAYQYVPTFDRTKFVDEPSTTPIDGIDGWEEWVVLDVAIAILTKEESDAAVLERERDRVEQRLRGKAGRRQSAPVVPVDMRRRGGAWRQ